jgi:hypothetical protein
VSGRQSKFLTIGSALAGLTAGLLIYVLLADIHNARLDTRTYELVHQMPVDAYVARSLWCSVALALTLLSSALHFIDRIRSRLWGKIAVFGLLLIVVVSIIQYVLSN